MCHTIKVYLEGLKILNTTILQESNGEYEDTKMQIVFLYKV